MVRLTRVQQQERTRAAVLAAAAEEFARYGYADAKVDRIADRAELTRGAVYSNFASKRSLYLAVLLDSLPAVAPGGAEALGETVEGALSGVDRPVANTAGGAVGRTLGGAVEGAVGEAGGAAAAAEPAGRSSIRSSAGCGSSPHPGW